MQEENFNLIVKYLSKETSEQEEQILTEIIKKDRALEKEYQDITLFWNSFEKSENKFDKNRISKLIAHKVLIDKMKKRNRFINITLRYAALFIGVMILSIFVYNDLNSIQTIENKTASIKEVTLPDNSVVILNKNAKIEYGNSFLKSFDRKVRISGEAYFKITKQNGRKFIVETEDYKITVLGTKFNVNTNATNKSVALTQGKIEMTNFKNSNSKFTLLPGEIVKFNKHNHKFEKKVVNPKIYTSWLSKKLEFDNFSLAELAELIQVRYNKQLVINNSELMQKRISGSAPSDDINLIINALEEILKTKILKKENQIIIN